MRVGLAIICPNDEQEMCIWEKSKHPLKKSCWLDEQLDGAKWACLDRKVAGVARWTWWTSNPSLEMAC